ncbi:MAG TPA: glucose 1-dehydrogenase [Verrucomicrobiae bacterium]|nr:glucose 1-dehydrogenase [Verrucomicrobiae bacterium]
MRLQDKVMCVTGASSGIGKAIAERFAKEGACVAFNWRAGGKLDAKGASQLAKTMGDKVIPVEGDTSKRADAERMVRETVEKFGRIDIAIANAGIEFHEPFLDVTDDHWNKVVAVNMYGAFVFTQAAARQMVKQGSGGKIIFTSSVHEEIPLAGLAPYCATKGGLRMLMRNMAIELAQYKINVNNIAPGAIATPINQEVLDDPKQLKEADSQIPWGRFGTPDEVASVAVFLGSDESSYVTGSTYFVDGGMTREVTKF